MPIFKNGAGKWTRFCSQCGKPFIKTARRQTHCEECQYKNRASSCRVNGKKAYETEIRRRKTLIEWGKKHLKD